MLWIWLLLLPFTDTFQRREVPILCYHQIRAHAPGDSKRSLDYVVTPERFAAQMKWLSENGYHAILPDQYIRHLTKGDVLPEKPVLLQFDDGTLSQMEIARPVLKRYGFKASFFIMTVTLGKKGYLSAEQVRQLADEGHTIGLHTWDHRDVRKYAAADWQQQVDRPRAELQKITGRPVLYFAYPFGLWDRKAAAALKARGFKAAFQLAGRADADYPLFTIRRNIVSGYYEHKRFIQFFR